MNNKHTPGPWEIQDTSITYGGFHTNPLQGGLVAASVKNIFDEPIDTADMRLIATAPEMLEMLRTLLQHNQEVADDDDHYCFDDRPVRALISKATGETT